MNIHTINGTGAARNRRLQSDASKPLPLLATAPSAAELLGISVRALHNYRKKPGFPAPIILSANSVRWRVSELVAWVDALQSSAAPMEEPLKLRAGRAARKLHVDPIVVDGLAGFQFPAPESQHQRGSQQSPAPSNHNGATA